MSHRRLLSLAFALTVASFGAAGSVRAESDSNKIRIAFVGDSISDGYWEGVSVTAARDPCLKALIEFGRFAKNSTGLTRPDRFDWVAELKRVGESFKPSLFVMSLGLNDRQSVVEHGQITMDDSPQYGDKYKERITAVLKNAAAAKAALLWIGLPAMRVPASDKDAREKNRLFEEAITAFGAPGIQYVPPWKLNQNGPDAFASYGPDANGRMVQIRTPDGEHFTVAGEMLTAVYLLPKILATVAQDGVAACNKGEASKGQVVKANKTEDLKGEAIKSEVTRAEATKSEETKSEPIKSEPTKDETIKNEPIKNEPTQSEPIKGEAIKADVIKSEAATEDTTKSDTIKDNALKDDAVKSETLSQDPPQPDRLQPQEAQ